MRTASQLAEQIRRRTELDLDRLADEITAQYVNRELQCQTVPFEKRGRPHHRRPKTALIALAAKRKILRRRIRELVVKHQERELEECVKDFESIVYFLETAQNTDFVEHQGG